MYILSQIKTKANTFNFFSSKIPRELTIKNIGYCFLFYLIALKGFKLIPAYEHICFKV